MSRERPPRAASLSESPMQTVQALQGICAEINSLMIFYSKCDGDLLLNPALLLHGDSHHALLTQRNLRIGRLNEEY